MKLVVGTRGSALATRQTADVVAALQSLHPDLVVETRIIQTKGDLTQAENIPLASFGDKGIFARELESALLAGEIDFAVHSMKDLAHTLPKGRTRATSSSGEPWANFRRRDCVSGPAARGVERCSFHAFPI